MMADGRIKNVDDGKWWRVAPSSTILPTFHTSNYTHQSRLALRDFQAVGVKQMPRGRGRETIRAAEEEEATETLNLTII